jgi:citrate synthase
MAGHVGERGTGLGVDVVCFGLVMRHPPVRERLQVAPARGELVGQDARQREATVRSAGERERTARREPDEGAGGAKGEAGQRFGQTRSPAEIRVAERTRLKLYSESCSSPTLQSRDPRRRRLVAKETLTITDNRTGRTFEVPIEDETIRATDLRQIKVQDDDFGLMTYDPAFMNTAACRSAITYIDGDKGILRYRGYPIEQLAERATFLEVAYLLSEGELPTAAQLKRWNETITYHTYVHTNIIKFLEGFRYDAHPMGMLLGVVGALSTFYPDAKHIHDPANRSLQKVRLLAKAPTIAAFAFRHSRGLPFVFPDNDLDYIGNFVNMTFSIGGRHKPNKVLQRALEILLILHADHEQNCSTSAVRAVGSSHVDPFSAISAGIAALYGPLHGGANEAVLQMLDEIGDKKNIPKFIEEVKAGRGRLMGFGHRVYKSYDPRAKLIKKVADEVFEQTGLNPKLEIALELERIALEDEYFIKRKLYPNVDFYSGLIYQAMGYPTEYFTVLFALGRMPGWLAQWEEMLLDKDQKIARPRQIFTGKAERPFVPIDKR